jgi:tetratricopeptide (TPR) repeat protein
LPRSFIVRPRPFLKWLVLVSGLLHLCAAGDADLDAARAAIAKGEYAKGLKAIEARLTDGLDAEPERRARTLRAQALSETGRYQDALAEAAKVETLAPKSPDALALHAEALLAVGQYDEAAKRIERALTADADHVQARLLSLELAERRGDREAARRQRDYFFARYSQGAAKGAEALTAAARAAEDADPHGAWRVYSEAHQADPKYLDAYLHAGFHCLSKYAWKFALTEFKKALELNPRCAVAHAGLAMVALRNSKYPQAEKAVEQALKINPNLTLGRELKAAMLTMEEQHEAAREQLEAVLAVNPNRLSALALLAAHHEALGQAAERDRAIQRALDLNPRYADLYTTLGHAAERRRQFPIAVRWARKAIELDAEDWEGHYVAGTNLLRIGEEKQGYRLLERAFQLNKFNVWAYNLLNVLDRDFKEKRFERIETEHFVLKLPASQSAVLRPYVEAVLDEAWSRFTEKYGVTPVGPTEYGGKVLVLFFPDHQQFSVRTVGLPNLGALGACFGQVVTMPAPGRGAMAGKNWRRVLEHEFCHAVTLQKTGYQIPRWFTEGISVHEEQEPQIRWDPLLARAVARDELLPLERLNTGFSRPDAPHQVPVSYYQSALIVRYLEETEGPDVLRRACELYAKGKQTEAVLPAVTGESLDELNRVTRAYAAEYAEQIKSSPPVGKTEFEALQKRVKENPDDAEAWCRLAAGHVQRRKFGPARKAAKKAAELDPALARAHTILGVIALTVDKNKADAKIRFHLAKDADPEHFASRLYLGLMAKEEGEAAEAIANLEAARRVYPRFYSPSKSPHLLLAELYRDKRQPQKAIDVLRELTELHNNSLKGFLMLGDLLAREGKHAEAAGAFLGAVYIDPFDLRPHLSAGKSFEALGAYDRALGEFTVAAHIDRRSLPALLGRARCLAAAGKTEDAKAAIAAVQAIDPANREALKLLKSLPD